MRRRSSRRGLDRCVKVRTLEEEPAPVTARREASLAHQVVDAARRTGKVFRCLLHADPGLRLASSCEAAGEQIGYALGDGLHERIGDLQLQGARAHVRLCPWDRIGSL
jgi:hypothetical protein